MALAHYNYFLMQQKLLDPSISEMLHSLREFNLGDVIKTKNAGMPIATFILGTCFIDHLSRISYFNKDINDAERFESFIDNYFPHEYKGLGKSLYLYLRSTLVHNYSVKGKFYLEFEPSYRHLKIAPDGRTFLNVDNFVNDLVFAFTIFNNLLINDVGDARKNAMDHNKKFPILIDKKMSL